MLVSVIIPNFNNARYIERCLSSVVDDPGVGEVLIYDNASTDDSIEVIRRLAHPKIILINGATNLGASLARNECVRRSLFDLIFFLDSDDFVSDGAVGQSAGALTDNELDLALMDMVTVDAEGRNPVLFLSAPTSPISGRDACTLTLGSWRIHSSGVLRKDIYCAAWEDFRRFHSDDEYLTRRIFLASSKVGAGKGILYYRQVPKVAKPEHLDGRMWTALRVLQLARDAGLDESAVRQQRNSVIRHLLGMARRQMPTAQGRARMREYLRSYDRASIPFKAGDLPYHLIDRLLRLLPR